jgi:hypothetical protein
MLCKVGFQLVELGVDALDLRLDVRQLRPLRRDLRFDRGLLDFGLADL